MTLKSEIAYIRHHAKKIKAIKLLGGKCIKCGESRYYVLDFHHKDGTIKHNTVNRLKTGRWSILKNEILKCELLCANCHGEMHNNIGINISQNGKFKRAFIDEHNLTSCEHCGYDKNIGALDFHHKKDKKFGITQAFMRQVSVTPLELLQEVNKCKILCKNCHREEHFDHKRFKKSKKQIMEKVTNLKEIQSKIDRQEVKKMLESGMKQVEIAKHFNASHGTISEIVKFLNTQ